jgi:hypothetical protein
MEHVLAFKCDGEMLVLSTFVMYVGRNGTKIDGGYFAAIRTDGGNEEEFWKKCRQDIRRLLLKYVISPRWTARLIFRGSASHDRAFLETIQFMLDNIDADVYLPRVIYITATEAEHEENIAHQVSINKKDVAICNTICCRGELFLKLYPENTHPIVHLEPLEPIALRGKSKKEERLEVNEWDRFVMTKWAAMLGLLGEREFCVHRAKDFRGQWLEFDKCVGETEHDYEMQ